MMGTRLFSKYKKIMTWIICLGLFCFNSITELNITAEKYIRKTNITYCMWWNWPRCYDCGWIVTKALRQEWYSWPKISSNTTFCIKKNTQAKAWDILINTNTWQRHVALITSDYYRWSVWIIDYVQYFTRPSYRIHGLYRWVYVLDKNCLIDKYKKQWN